MHVISSFEQSAYLELAINKLQENGIQKQNLAAVPMEPVKVQSRIFDTIHRADGISLFDLAAVMGTVGSVLGASFGFELRWGPIIWGLIGLAIGAVIGFTIDWITTNRRTKKTAKNNREVVLIIQCNENELAMVKSTLQELKVLSIGLLN